MHARVNACTHCGNVLKRENGTAIKISFVFLFYSFFLFPFFLFILLLLLLFYTSFISTSHKSCTEFRNENLHSFFSVRTSQTTYLTNRHAATSVLSNDLVFLLFLHSSSPPPSSSSSSSIDIPGKNLLIIIFDPLRERNEKGISAVSKK